MAPKGKSRRKKTGRASRYYLAAGLLALVVGAVACYAYLLPHSGPETKPVILYMNQGNGVVNRTNFDAMAGYANSSGYNTVFFQTYRKGVLLFSQHDLQTFVNQTHLRSLRVFFSLWITNSSQQIPSSIFGLGEDGVNLDMSYAKPFFSAVYAGLTES